MCLPRQFSVLTLKINGREKQGRNCVHLAVHEKLSGSSKKVQSQTWESVGYYTYPGLLSAICFQSSSPRFIAIQECVATFLWETEAACPIKDTKDDSQVRKGKVIVFIVSTYYFFLSLALLVAVFTSLLEKANYSEAWGYLDGDGCDILLPSWSVSEKCNFWPKYSSALSWE